MSADKAGKGDSILDRFPDTPPKHNPTAKKQTKEQQLALDVFAWFFNVSTSVLIVFVNKQLMSGSGLNYRFGIFWGGGVGGSVAWGRGTRVGAPHNRCSNTFSHNHCYPPQRQHCVRCIILRVQ